MIRYEDIIKEMENMSNIKCGSIVQIKDSEYLLRETYLGDNYFGRIGSSENEAAKISNKLAIVTSRKRNDWCSGEVYQYSLYIPDLDLGMAWFDRDQIIELKSADNIINDIKKEIMD